MNNINFHLRATGLAGAVYMRVQENKDSSQKRREVVYRPEGSVRQTDGQYTWRQVYRQNSRQVDQ